MEKKQGKGANILPPDALLRTWFDMLMKDIGDNAERKAIKKRAKENLLGVFGSTEAAVAYFKSRGWVK